ncbi:hypothetical protein [Wenxinia marina]|uniref:Wenxma_19, whole genome shotgun sequence n=1 Tax=Wenxinia marina DSM 24838 TaxID=1123501 RepID=A0A0D0NHH3_9RHOB|nr:hypothetical protein [Wenxinia marina]KIQ67770.1 hypothetical protein Wenmar_03730 [Wenxinia marina DSM 24838]GGL77387.1 hypothetical protein GCM10011392_34760 [Wenxinia marina]
MQAVGSTAIVLAVVAFMLVRRTRTGFLTLFALLPMGMMAAFNLPAVGGTSIIAVDLAVLTLLAISLVQRGAVRDLLLILGPRSPGLWLLAYLVYAAVATLFFPRIFAGETEVFTISRLSNVDRIVSVPLAPVTGNLSQMLRLMLALGAFVATALVMLRLRDTALVRRAMAIVTLVHAAMGGLDILTHAAGVAWLLDWARTANYVLTLGQSINGIGRMIGGFPEASSYGYLCVGLLGYWLQTSIGQPSVGGRRDRLAGWMLLLTAILTVRSTSSSAYVGAAILLVVFGLNWLLTAARGGQGIDRRVAGVAGVALALLPSAAMAVYVLYQFVPGFETYLDRTLFDKLASASGTERMNWNRQALQTVWDTNLLGAGLGSVRASNWVVAVLGCTGLPGLLLLVGFLWRLFTSPGPDADTGTQRLILALRMGLVGFLARAVVVKATPNLDASFFAMAGIVAGLTVAQVAATSRTGPSVRPASPGHRLGTLLRDRPPG